jgi:hypothetical protein
MAGEDPAHYLCSGEVSPFEANSDLVGDVIKGAADLLETAAEFVAEAL